MEFVFRFGFLFHIFRVQKRMSVIKNQNGVFTYFIDKIQFELSLFKKVEPSPTIETRLLEMAFSSKMMKEQRLARTRRLLLLRLLFLLLFLLVLQPQHMLLMWLLLLLLHCGYIGLSRMVLAHTCCSLSLLLEFI